MEGLSYRYDRQRTCVAVLVAGSHHRTLQLARQEVICQTESNADEVEGAAAAHENQRGVC